LMLGTKLRTYYTTDRLEERGAQKDSSLRSTLKGRDSAIVNPRHMAIINPTYNRTVSKAALGKLIVKDRVEHAWVSPSP